MDNNIIKNNELEALNNCLVFYKLNGYTIHTYYQQDKRRTKSLYFLTDSKGTSLTGHWDYSELNNFISGYGKAASGYNKLKEQNNSLLEALKIAHEYVFNFAQKGGTGEVYKDLGKVITAIQKAEQ